MRQDAATNGYVARRSAEGKSTREIKRCLKRYVGRQLFCQLQALPDLAWAGVQVSCAVSSLYDNVQLPAGRGRGRLGSTLGRRPGH